MSVLFTRMLRAVLTGLFFLAIPAAQAQVVINEYSCSNESTVTDPFGKYSDWVELYNTGGTAATLSGLYLSDDPTDLLKWQIPGTVTIPAGGKRMIFCNDRGSVSGTVINAKFKLTQTKGEWFIISTATSVIVDSVKLRLTQKDHSRGRVTDGAGTWGIFNNPTPNAVNTGAKIDYAPKVTFSLAGGFFSGPQSVSLSCPDLTAVIRYTLDGSQPTGASPAYTGTPIAITATKLLRARAFPAAATYLPSFGEHNTYFINETISPNFNVVSVGGNYNSFFYGWAGDIYNTIEFFDKAHNFKFKQEGRSSPHGNDSWGGCDQKGFRYYAEDELGVANSMNYQFFQNSPRDSYKVVILKAAGSDNYPGYNTRACHIRDVFSQTLAGDYGLEFDYRRYDATILFVNGEYWGVYEIRDHVDNDYTEYYYGQKKGKVDILKYWGGMDVEDGSDTGYVNLYNYILANPMTVPANYEHVKQFLNVKSFAQYFIFNTFLVNSDMLNWNTMWWRGRAGSGVKWKFSLWDQDNVLDLGENFTGLGTTTAENSPCNLFTKFLGNPNIMHTDMLVRLMENPEFAQLYNDQFIEMLNGPLDCAKALPHLDSLIANIQPEMVKQIARWGGTMTQWQANVTHMRQQLEHRCLVMSQKLDSCMDLNPQRLKVNVSPAGAGTVQLDAGVLPLPYAWSKVVNGDTTYTLTAIPASPYYTFSHWEKDTVVNSFAPGATSNPVTYNFNYKDSVTAVFIYFNPDSIPVTFNVSPDPSFGTVKLEGTSLPSYPYTTTLDRRNPYSLQAIPTGVMLPSGATSYFVRWERKHRDSTVIHPDSLTASVSFTYRIPDTIVAVFDTIPAWQPNPDSLPVTFMIQPSMAYGNIRLNGTVITSFPYTTVLDRKKKYQLQATATGVMPSDGSKSYFVRWEKKQADSTIFLPDSLSSLISFKYRVPDTITAVFDAIPLPPVYPVDEQVSVPTAFTPNGDGRNDQFFVVYGPDLMSLDLRVYNRWGAQVYWANTPDQKWDGTYNGIPCPMGTYYYVLEVVLDNGGSRLKKQIKGEVTLIR